MENHLISTEQRRNLIVPRLLSNTLGGEWAGKVLSIMARLQMLSQSLKTYYILSTHPLIVYIGNTMQHTFEIAELMKNQRVYFIKNSYHTFERPDRLESLAREVFLFKQKYPQHSIHFICPTEQEKKLFDSKGISPSYFINKNAFVDENMFSILPEVIKEFDAIHNGQLKPYKRHELANQVRNLAIITYQTNKSKATLEEDNYIKKTHLLLQHAYWINNVDQFVLPREVSSYLNRARVGLCLSAEEGPMAASIEYLLCGLPIVSTRSLGGREVFFSKDYVEIVDDTPQAVANGVEKMVKRNLDPTFIRKRTIEKVCAHRKRFIELVEKLLIEAGMPRNYEEEFDSLFVNKLRVSATFPAGFLSHAACGMPVQLCRRLVQTCNQ